MKAEFEASLKRIEYSRKYLRIDIKEGSGRKGEELRKRVRPKLQML